MRIERRLGIRSAYGQLVLIVFLPIAILASVGAGLVFSETRRTLQSEQDALAQAALIRYEPMVRPLLPSLGTNATAGMLEERLSTLELNGITRALAPSESAASLGRRYMADKMYRIRSEQHVQRLAILDDAGTVIINTGHHSDMPWGQFDTQADSVWRLKTQTGTAYGMPMLVRVGEDRARFWLLVEMDDEPFVIAYYRILLALAITGLTTVLLLLLILNLYSKRWIAPVYEMRLYLQRLRVDNITKPFAIRSDGEFYLLQHELNQSLRRLGKSFSELKKHSEQTEADLQQAFDEMEMQNISIRRAHDMVVSSSEAKSVFLANISHELRTPLNAIDGFINLLARHGGLDAQQALYVQTIKKSSAHLLALVNDVLDFSKIEAGKLILEHQRFNLYDSVYEVADMLSPMALEKQLRMSVLFYQDVPNDVIGDSLRVKQVLTNLLANAIKFTDTGGVAVRVRLEETATEDGHAVVHISVTDSGRGVDKATQAQLFKSFGQGDLSVTRRYGGTGLGLVISKQLTHLMGGEIGFMDNVQENIAQNGATFWFTMSTGLSEADALVSSEDKLLNDDSVPKQHILVWINHAPTMQVMRVLLAETQVMVHEAHSLAQLLEILSAGEVAYEWVVADSFGQKGDLTALLRQLRLHYQGRLAIFGYEVGLDGVTLARYSAHALHEPLGREQLYYFLSGQDSTHTAPIQRPSQWQGVRVLAVDDHMPNLLVLEALLGELGIDMVQATSGFDAIDVMTYAYASGNVGAARIDLIFMDISMPTMSGLEASLAIRKLEANYPNMPSVPIIALTAHGLSDEKDELVQSGLNDYAIKPIAQNELVHLLQKWLNREAGATALPVLPMPDAWSPTLTAQKAAADTDIERYADVAADELAIAIAADDETEAVLQLAVVDWADGLSRAANKPDLAKKLLSMMIDTAEDEIHALSRAWAVKDIAALTQAAHRIVGAARYTGTPQLRMAAQLLEDKCRALPEHALASRFVLLKPAFLSLTAALTRLAQCDLDRVAQG